MTTKLLYLVALLHKACLLHSDSHTVQQQNHAPYHTLPQPSHIGAYVLLRKEHYQSLVPLANLYQFHKKLPTTYNLFNSSHLIALKDTQLKEGDAIIVKRAPLLKTPGSHLFFDVATPSHTYKKDPADANLLSYPLQAGRVILYSWHQYDAEPPIVETYVKEVTKH